MPCNVSCVWHNELQFLFMDELFPVFEYDQVHCLRPKVPQNQHFSHEIFFISVANQLLNQSVNIEAVTCCFLLVCE